MNENKTPWNHNYAYHNWILRKVGCRTKILDVGCGKGTLAAFLRNEDNDILGIDPSTSSIQKANNQNLYDNVRFIQTTFEDFEAECEEFDTVIFVASIHHMDMLNAINKAKKLLKDNGMLIVVGLSKPSSLFDKIVEAARVLPSGIISALKNNKTSEEMKIDVSYDFPTMSEIRKICNQNLPGHRIQYGLHYRYLLTWKK